mmetsp:Transcript_174860/g.560664  ORF Transcript_174860/g.560664 Transcript_174860/m.560664 type:complete len:653 (+) Transcript_174860:54-2012(+)
MVSTVFGPADIVVMAVLLGLTVAKGIWASWEANRRSRNNAATVSESDNFFLAGREMPFWAVGLSIFASNIGTEHFVGLAGAAAASGMPVSIYEWSAGLLIFFLGWGLAPMYLALGLTTMPEWFERRFNPPCRLLVAVVSILAYVLTKIAATVFAGAVLLEVVLGLSMWVSVPIILAFTAAYAAFGGLRAVMFTDVGQASIFILGGVIGLGFALAEIGGVSGLLRSLDSNGLAYFTTTLRPPYLRGYPWTGMLIGQPIMSVWYWCVDQTLVQRVFSARSLSHAQGGCSLAGYLKILPPFLMVIPGMIARCFFEECLSSEGVRFPQWCDMENIQRSPDLSKGPGSNQAYPLFITRSFPDGLRGLMVVSMILAMMSSLDSVFNCVATVFTEDIVVRFLYPSASAHFQVWIGRLATVVAASCGLAWLPTLTNRGEGLYLATQSVMAHLTPTLVAVFFLGLLWPRANGIGAFVGMLAGFAFGIVRWVISNGAVCDDWDASSFRCMDFNHIGSFVFLITLVVTIVVSLLSGKPDVGKLYGTCVTVAVPAAGVRPPSVEFRLATKASHRQMLLTSGLFLLAVMGTLCVGFGYSSAPWEGGGTTVSGGIICILCVVVVAAATHLGMLGVALGEKSDPDTGGRSASPRVQDESVQDLPISS